MRLFVIVFLLFASAYSASAQNFQPFRNKFKYQYSYSGEIRNMINSGLIHGLEVDSANIVNSDSVFYFNRLTVGENFWGRSMVKKPNGEYRFLVTGYNKTDTVIIKTQETLGTQWIFTLNNVLYTTSYDSYKQETVLTNQTDYVKTFVVENASGFKDSIKISENYGLIYSFPFLNHFFPARSFNLTYIINSKVGINKLNYFNYFNYDAGDILIYRPNLTYPNHPPIGDNVMKVLSKSISLDGDTVTYSFSSCYINDYNGGVYSAFQNHYELIVTECSVTGGFPYITPLSFPPNKYGEYYSFAPNVLNNQILELALPYIFEAPVSDYLYRIGLGLVRYAYSGGRYGGPSSSFSNIEYIKQSNINDDCDGLEAILDTKTLHATSSNLIVAPNPFDDSFALTATDLSQGKWNVRITSALGVEVFSAAIVISSSNQLLDLSNLPALTAGIYFLSLENDSQVYSQKIIKK